MRTFLVQFHAININICHFLYQTLQPFLEFLLSNREENNNYFVGSKRGFPGESYLPFHRKMFEIIFNDFGIKDHDNREDIENICVVDFPPRSPYYNCEIFKYLRKLVYCEYNIIDKPLEEKYKVLYVRNENQTGAHNKCARMIKNYENIQGHFDLVLQNLSTIPLKDQMTLFSKISHFVCAEGTHISNVFFMNKKCRILAIINTGVFFDDRLENYDCWQKTFGGEEFVDEIHTNIIATKLEDDFRGESAPWYHKYNHNIVIDEFLEKKVIKWLNIK